MATNPTNYVLMIAELRRSYAHLDSYKSDIVVLSGLDAGDRLSIDAKFRSKDATPCQYDKEDRRFVLKGSHFAPMEVLNCLSQERGYKIIYPPQQHGIPLKQGAMDDKFALLYQLSKDIIQKPKTQMSSPAGVNTACSTNKQPFSDAIYTDIIKKQKIQVMIPERITSGTAINKQPFNDAIYCGKGWDKLMHAKIDSSDRRKPDIEDSESDELETEEDEDDKCLDMNIVYDEETGGDCGDGGDY